MTIQTNDAVQFASRAYAESLDRADSLRPFRNEFHIPFSDARQQPEVYLMGNSLGLQPKRTAEYVAEELEKWKTRGVRGHHEGKNPWLPYHEFLCEPMARIVGALPREVVVMNSLTTNLHLMLATFYRPTRQRHKILIEARAFPSDRYAVESQLRWHGRSAAESLLVVEPRSGEDCLRDDDICEMIDKHGADIAVVVLPGVQYLTGQVIDIQQIARAAHRHDIVVGIDLAHAAGNVVLNLHDWDIDFAVWCTYKYLNSGPGSVGGCFVHERHAANATLPRLAGWWGHDKPSRFEMPDHYVPIPTAEGWQVSNPPILSMAAIWASLEVFDQAGGMEPLRRKSERLSEYAIQLLTHELKGRVELLTPMNPARRGCQLSIRTKSAGGSSSLQDLLERRGIATDFRRPDVLRAAPVPLYNSFVDVWEFVDGLRDALKADRA